jgi:hypothetical protein
MIVKEKGSPTKEITVQKRKSMSALLASAMVLAGCLTFSLSRAADTPAGGGKSSADTGTPKREAVSRKTGAATRAAGPAKKAASQKVQAATAPAKADEMALLQEQLAQQQEQLAQQQQQIEQLRAAMEQQQQLLERTVRGRESSPTMALAPGATLGEVASLRPLIPGSSPRAGVTVLPGGGRPQGTSDAESELVKSQLEAVADSAAQTNLRVTKLETDLKDSSKKADGLGKQLGNFNFIGDLRIRYEPWFQEGNPVRNRERVRARLNITGKLTDEISGGISFATGSLDDPVSTNQTMTGYFNRKNFGIDRAFITYKPKLIKQLALDFGKFKYPWYRTPLTFDSDVNPEGFAQTLSFDLKTPGLKNITLVGFELPFNELSGSFRPGNRDTGYVLDPTKPAYDSFVFGGQLQMKFKLSDKAKLGLYAAGVNFNRADPIALALISGDLKPSLANSNTYSYAANGTTVTGYAYKFAYLDLIAQVDYQLTPKWPLTAFIDFVNNTRGPLGENRRGFWTEVMFGQTKNPKDVQFGYRFIDIGKDAVIGAFNESDLRSSTNVRDHVFLFGYQLHKNTTLQWTYWYGHLKNPLLNPALVPAGVRNNCTTAPFTSCRDPWLSRMQFDLNYKF